ncbi:MAG: 50S ribosomal protein L11 methyltransferase [Bacillota bacterium]
MWYEIYIITENKEEISKRLHWLKTNGVLIEKDGVKGYFKDYKKVISYFEKSNFKKIEINVTKVKNDWQKKWKEGFKSIGITDKIRIKPFNDKKNYKNPIVIKIDPGMSFGTGTHETTFLMIKLIQKYIKKDDLVLDIGCGSGILSIISKKLNARKVFALDIDKEAIKACKKNLRLNNIKKGIEVKKTSISDKYNNNYNIVLANILYTILIDIIKDIVKVLKKDTIFISSGITLEKYEKVEEIYEKNNLKIIEKIQKGKWIAVVAKVIK